MTPTDWKTMKINPEDRPSRGKRKRVPATRGWPPGHRELEPLPPLVSAALRVALNDVSAFGASIPPRVRRKGVLL